MKFAIRFERAMQRTSPAVQVLGFGLSLLFLGFLFAQKADVHAESKGMGSVKNINVECKSGKQTFKVGPQINEVQWFINNCACENDAKTAKEMLANAITNNTILGKHISTAPFEGESTTLKDTWYCYNIDVINKLQEEYAK